MRKKLFIKGGMTASKLLTVHHIKCMPIFIDNLIFVSHENLYFNRN